MRHASCRRCNSGAGRSQQISLWRLQAWHGGIGSGHLAQLPQPASGFDTGKQLDQFLALHRAGKERLRCLRQFEIAAYRHQPTTERQKIECLAQILADHATNLIGVCHQIVERAVLSQPFHRRLRAALADTRYVIDGVAHQGQVVDDTFRRYAKLGAHAGLIKHFVAHGVDQCYVLVDQLRQILVAGRDDDFDALCRRLPRQRADDVIGLDPGFHDQRPTERLDAGVQRLDLAHQIIGHRRPVGLVFGIPVIAESLAFGVKNTGFPDHVLRLVVAFQPA